MSADSKKIVKVLVKPRVNPRVAAKFIAAGVESTTRSDTRQAEIICAHAAEAVKLGRDAFRAGRADATGKTQTDSGTPVFGFKAEGRESVCLRNIIGDIEEKFGWKITGVSLFQKKGDTMYFLVVAFEEGKDALVISDELRGLIDEVLGRTFGHLHVWLNPDGSVTVNPAHSLEAPELEEVKDLRVLDTDFHVRCVRRK